MCAEVALGGKTGESRSLVDGPDKEEKMKIPNPPPLGIFGPLFSVLSRSFVVDMSSNRLLRFAQMRNVFAGYRLSAEAAAATPRSTTPAAKVAKPAAGKDVWKRSKGPASAVARNAPAVEEDETTCPPDVKMVLKNITLDIEQDSKISILGKNGMPYCTV